MYQHVQQLYVENKISAGLLIILNNELQSHPDICALRTNLEYTDPYSFSVFIKQFIFTSMMTMPFRCVFSFCDSVVRVVTFVLYVLVSLDIVA